MNELSKHTKDPVSRVKREYGFGEKVFCNVLNKGLGITLYKKLL